MPFLANPPFPWPWPGRKIVPATDARGAAEALPSPRVFTNGVFDIVPRGHCASLDAARSVGRSLIVGLNSAASARRLGKGPERPIHDEADRAFVLACRQAVDMIVLFDEDTPVELMERLRPEITVQGGDCAMATLAEARLVERWGGMSMSLPFLAGHSSTSILRRLEAARTRSPSDRIRAAVSGVPA